MAGRKALNSFLQFWKGKTCFNEDNDPLEISRERSSSSQARIQEFERAKTAALIQQAERLCASQKAHTDAVLKRLGVQQDTPLSRQPSTPPRRLREFSPQQGRTRPDLNGCHWMENKNCKGRSMNTHVWDERDTFFEMTQHQMDELFATDRSLSPDSPLSPVDRHTPSELRAIPLLRSPDLSTFTPTPPQTTRTGRNACITVQTRGAVKVADGSTVQSSKAKADEFQGRFGRYQQFHHPSPQPLAAPKRMTMAPPAIPALNCRSQSRQPLAVPTKTTVVPKPPKTTAPTNRNQSRQTPAAPKKMAKVPRHPKTVAPTNRRGPQSGTHLEKENLKPLTNPSQSLSCCFKQLESEDWEKKVEGLKTVRALARHHPEILQTKLHEICIVLTEEVKNLRSNVACAAIDTVAELHVDLGKTMDPEAERTGCALLLKLAQTTSTFIHQRTNRALNVLVDGCSPGRVISALLNPGLSHPCAAVRGSTAEHLHQLADIIGEDRIMTTGKTFTERFIIAVSKMAVDAAPDVRQHGQKMLEGLAQQQDFIVLWDKLVPKKDQRPLAKILKKMRQ